MIASNRSQTGTQVIQTGVRWIAGDGLDILMAASDDRTEHYEANRNVKSGA